MPPKALVKDEEDGVAKAANGKHEIGTDGRDFTAMKSWTLPAIRVYIHTAVHHPCAMLLGVLALILPAAYLGVLNFSLDDPEGGQLMRDALEAEQAHAFLRAGEIATSALSAQQRVPRQTDEVAPLWLYYVAGRTAAEDVERTGNVLTVKNIQRAAALEDELTGLDAGRWDEVCLRERGQLGCAPFLSAVPYLRNATDEASLRAAIDAMYETLDGSAGAPLGGLKASWFFEQAREHSRYESYIMRTSMRLGAPLDASWYAENATSFLNWADTQDAQMERMMSRFLRPAETHIFAVAAAWDAEPAPPTGGALSLLFAQNWLYIEETGRLILNDLVFAIGSIGVVFAVLWAYTSSPLLAGLGLLQIVLPFPVTLFCYSVVLRIKLFSVVQAMAVFLILGIGTDDVLILTGALLQEKDAAARPATERFACAFSSAFTAMLTTTVTTATAFGMTAIIKIPTVRYFAVFCSLMVVINFVLVCTMYLFGLILWDRHLRFRKCAWPRQRTANAAGPSANVPHDALAEPIEEVVSIVHRILSRTMRWLGGKVVRHPYKILTLFGAATVAFTVCATMLGDPTREGNPYWPKSHHLGRRWHLEFESLVNATADDGIELRLVFGIEGIDRSGTDPSDDDDLGEPVWLQSFDLGDAAAQEHLVWLCDEIEAEAEPLSVASVECFMRELKEWRHARQEGFPVAPAAHFVDVAKEFLKRRVSEGVRDQLGLVLEGEELQLRFANVLVRTSAAITSPYRTKTDLKAAWLEFVQSLEGRRPAPDSCGAPFIISLEFLQVAAATQAMQSAWTSVALSLTLAFLVLLFFTRNLRIALIATLVIGCVVLATMGSMYIYGWKMDVFESICITILVGVSIDYTAHLGIAYVEHGEAAGRITDRRAATQYALSRLGVSVTAGAASTAGACLFLFPPLILFLPKFGQFMCTAVVAAFLYAMCVFTALLAVLGPVGEQGRLHLGAVRALTGRIAASAPSLEMISKWTTPITSKELDDATAPTVATGAVSLAKDAGKACQRPRCSPRLPCLKVFLLVCVALLGGAVGLQALSNVAGDSLAPDSGVPAYHMPAFAELAEGWNEMAPVGATTCSRGDPFVFFVRKGRTDRVILEFMGGGACWSDATCGQHAFTFFESLDKMRTLFNRTVEAAPARDDAGGAVGESAALLLDVGLTDPAAPEHRYTHVYVPYCTGDLHWGNATVRYKEGVTVEHRGAVNAQTAVDWLQANLPSPERILVTGCSAGSYASIFWAAKIAPFYEPRGTRIVQFGDSGMGIVTRAFLTEAYPRWNMAAAFPWAIVPEPLQANRTNEAFATYNLSMPDFYRFAAGTYPTVRWSQYSSAFDENQAFFAAAMQDDDYERGEPPLAEKEAWAARMRAEYNDSALRSMPNYAHWIGRGDEHCVIPYNRYWWATNTDGAELSAWVRSMMDGQNATTVDCAVPDPAACLVGVERSHSSD